MNFLAHVYLSDDDKQLTVGNFIGDFVKGKQYNTFPERIREGILLHRAIDSYTDSHPLTAEARSKMYAPFGKYAGIYLDIFYDYFLATNWSKYHTMPLRKFTRRFYLWLMQNYIHLPLRVKGFLPNMMATNRLFSYHTLNGIENALRTMSAHTSLPNQSTQAVQFIKDNNDYLQKNFTAFFADLIEFVNIQLKNIK